MNKEEHPRHDQIVLACADHLDAIAKTLCLDEDAEFDFALEYKIDESSWVDLAILARGKAVHLLEIKSADEPQSVSGWTRQVRRYEERAGVPCTLVLAHDLLPWQKDYLALARVRVLDLPR